ncbi:MAG: protein-tyrosine phosphatase family protein, partial [Nitrososphaerales archaeon]
MFGSYLLRRVYGLLARRPMSFSFIDEYVAGSACPMSKREVDWLKKKGFKAMLSLTENPINVEWLHRLVYKNVPMKDHSVPTLEELREAVDFVASKSNSKQAVVVHCAAGKGRTGTVLAAYMCEKHGLTPQESISRLRSKRPGSVEKKQVTS